MARIARSYIKFPHVTAYYHIFSHLLDHLPYLTPAEKEYLLKLLRLLSQAFHIRLLSYALLGNHLHLIVKTLPRETLSEEEALRRAFLIYPSSVVLLHSPSYWVEALTDLSRFMKELLQRFTQWTNRMRGRVGHFYRGRFRSILLEGQDALVAACVYVDLNPVRAGLARRVDEYRWVSFSARRAGQDWLLPLKEELGMEEDKYGKLLEDVGKKGLEGKGKIEEETGSRLIHILSYKAEGLVYGAGEKLKEILVRLPLRRRVKAVAGLYQA